MKKIKYVAPVLLASTLLFCACKGSTVSIGLSANWNKDTTIGTIDTASIKPLETLTYEVTFEGPETTGYAVHYGKGTYTTTLETYRFDEMESSQYGYHYRTELNIPVWFTAGEETSETFQDTLVSEVWFLDLAHSLQPVKSKKYGSSYTPVANAPKSLSDRNNPYYVYYEDYTCNIVYNNPLTEADISISYFEKSSTLMQELNTSANAEAKQPAKTENTYKTSLKSTNYFDNEQLFFVLRGYDMSATVTLGTLNPAAFKSQSKVKLSDIKSAPHAVKFTMTDNGTQTEVDKSIDSYEASIVYSTGMPGQAQKLVYAATTDTKSNEYRNVLLYKEVPLFSSLGTLKYTLREATFY